MNKRLREIVDKQLTELEGDHSLEELAEVLESLARQTRQSLMKQHERDWLNQIRACYRAQGLNRYFHTSTLKTKVNLVNLEAFHWIEELSPSQPLTIGFTNPSGMPYDDPNQRYQDDLRAAWHRGTPYRVTTRGKLSLSQGHLFWGIAIGEILYALMPSTRANRKIDHNRCIVH